MALWLVRAGKQGEREEFVLNHGIGAIGWDELPDLSRTQTKGELYNMLQEAYPDAKRKTLLNWLSQVWPFVREMKEGDLVALPSKRRPVIHFGRVKGPYRYTPKNPEGARHTRPVEWFAEVPRDKLDQDLLYSLGAFMTVCRIQRNNAEERIRRVLENKPLPADGSEEIEPPADLEEHALDLIRQHIARKFKGHRLAYLVEAILQAEGYITYRSPEGPDGGVDIVAGRGPLGFDAPRLAVQVKSGDGPIGTQDLNQLRAPCASSTRRRGSSWPGAGSRARWRKKEASRSSKSGFGAQTSSFKPCSPTTRNCPTISRRKFPLSASGSFCRRRRADEPFW